MGVKTIAIAGNPNVGKSTIFNALTGMHQHTGNWTGKTVANAKGYCKTAKNDLELIDIPGTYSLFASSKEEEVARNFLCFGNADANVVVCDATCLERNLNLVLQIIEVSPCTVVCVNLLDEAKRKGIIINLERLSELLSVPVVGTVARKKRTLNLLKCKIDEVLESLHSPVKTTYPNVLEDAISIVENALHYDGINTRWLALRLLDGDTTMQNEICCFLGKNVFTNEKITNAVSDALKLLKENGIEREQIANIVTSAIFEKAESIASEVVTVKNTNYTSFDRRLDGILTSKILGFPLMLLMLAFIFWITISGANYPSALLSRLFGFLGERLDGFLKLIDTPPWLSSLLSDGVYNVLTWVMSVMLPPMAIFFPLFTLLEDAGYLPRIAYNLDYPFKCCGGCGKQALTMCMGFGCNAVGAVGCRIIDSPRERLIAIITNSLVPCNGRFPTLILLISIFFVGNALGATFLLTLFILLGVFATIFASKLLSVTLLRGLPSSFILELPPYRKPQFSKVIVRSVFDRTLFVLGRAVAVAAPAGLVIWLSANIHVDGTSLLSAAADFLGPFAKLLGLDGVILIAFILGFPANEIVLPIILMAYLEKGTLVEIGNYAQIKELLTENGWTWVTAVCTMIFSLFHWPCSTTVLTIKKETGSIKWTAVSVILPTLIGMLLCFIVASVSRII